MDTKALAKSKRAHSQHHSKKHYPTQTSKEGGTGKTGSEKKSSGKQAEDQPRPSRSSKLPSNWDRYAEEDSSGLVDHSSSVNPFPDVVVPKTKGADYSFLLSEAKSESGTRMSSESFSLLDDDLTGFNQGVGALLSVWGQCLLAQMEDDNFDLENKATGNNEASFFSLNLDALAEQLAKVDISQRLFIEADLIPPEMCEELQSSSNQEYDQDQATYGSEVIKNESDEIAFHDFLEEDKIVDQYNQLSLSKTTNSSQIVSASSNNGRAKSTSQVHDELWQSGGSGQKALHVPKSDLFVNHDPKQTTQQSRFAAAAAEAELDMLLNSFGETGFLESPGSSEKPNYGTHLPQHETSTSSLSGIPSVQLASAESLKKGSVSSKSKMMTANLGDTIDDLLNETSTLTNQGGSSQPHEVMAASLDIQSSTANPVSKSKVLDDFDAWLDTI